MSFEQLKLNYETALKEMELKEESLRLELSKTHREINELRDKYKDISEVTYIDELPYILIDEFKWTMDPLDSFLFIKICENGKKLDIHAEDYCLVSKPEIKLSSIIQSSCEFKEPYKNGIEVAHCARYPNYWNYEESWNGPDEFVPNVKGRVNILLDELEKELTKEEYEKVEARVAELDIWE